MRHPRADIREILDAVEIRSATTFSIASERFEPASTAADDLTSRLASALYYRKYCRPTRRSVHAAGFDARRSRVFVEELSHANSGSGTWEPGWIVQAVEPDGSVVVRRRRDDLLVWARPHQYRSSDGAPAIGSVGRVLVAKELREMLQGYYMAFGDADCGEDEDGNPSDIVRFYWHLTAEGARPWIRELTGRFNAAGIGFRAKVLSDPASYVRADAGVLYVERSEVARTLDLLPEIHASARTGLRSATPMFTKRLAPGLAVAEDPGDGRSFGQHRCQLIAEALVCAFDAAAVEFSSRLQAVVKRFEEEGLSVARPWLNMRSQDVYHWPSAGARTVDAGRT
jgi:hypothetical protein